MSGLPDSDCRAVGLYLIDVAAFNPDRLALDDGLLDDCRLLNDWLLDDHRLLHNDRLLNNRRLLYNDSRAPVDDCACDRPTDHTADKSRPEIATATPPVAAVVVMVATVPSVMDRRRVMESSMMRSAMPATGKCPSRGCRKGNCYYEFLHLICPFLFRLKLVCRRADQSADNRADCGRAKRNPSGVPAAVVNVVNDMMPRRRRRALRTPNAKAPADVPSGPYLADH